MTLHKPMVTVCLLIASLLPYKFTFAQSENAMLVEALEQQQAQKNDVETAIKFAIVAIENNDITDHKHFFDKEEPLWAKGPPIPILRMKLIKNNVLAVSLQHRDRKDPTWDRAVITFSKGIDVLFSPEELNQKFSLQFKGKEKDTQSDYYVYTYEWILNTKIKVRIAVDKAFVSETDTHPSQFNLIYIDKK